MLRQKRACPLCGSEARPLSPLPSCDRDYYHCSECDLIFLCRRQLLSSEEERCRYLQHDNCQENEGYVTMFEEFLDHAVLPFCDRGLALDFGCGPGPVLGDLLRLTGFDVDLYDPFFFCCGDYRQRSYDLITSTEVFEHLAYPQKILNELCDILRPGGILAVMTHLHPGPGDFADWWYHRDPTHITFYSATTAAWLADNWPLDLVFTDQQKMLTYRRTAL